MAGNVAIRLLGPVEVWTGDHFAPVAGVKLQSVLAQLALESPRAVSDDRLIDEVWGDEPPANPANALQALVSGLRRLLGRDAVARQGAGYVLRLDPDDTDAVRLDRLVQEGSAAAAAGDHRTAVARFRDAIALRRGPPLAELGDRWFARHAITRLDELELTALEGLVDAELALGHHDDVRSLLVDLVARQPLRERFHAQLVLTLYRSGRQADALRAAAAARRHLRDELGLEPGPELRDLERAVLAHDPALRAPVMLAPSGAARSSVPEPLTSFVGRDEELAVLDRDDHRLVTLVGPAGVGKTRLATEWARRHRGNVALYFVELAPVAAAKVGDAIAGAVGAFEQESAGGEIARPLERTVGRLGDSNVWLFLDNCEHVADATAGCVIELLSRCPGLRIAATSREPLGVEGEYLFTVDTLDVDLAGRLFVERARAVQPLIEAVDAGELSELCHHLDGLPLAIELAAARTRTLPVPEISARLRDRFRLLRSAQRIVDPRHQGLGAAIDWSYDLLFEDERRAFRRLAVFRGGATSAAIDAICGPDGFDVATRLVNRSLLTADTSGTEVRIGMLDSLRDYGLLRLADQGELDDARAAHLAWCTSLVERVGAEARRSDQVPWLDRLDREHDNVTAALSFAVANDPPAAIHLVNSLFSPWWMRGRRQELRDWYDACLAAAPDAAPADRAIAMAVRAYLAEPGGTNRWRGELEEVLAAAEREEREALAMLGGPSGDVRRAASVKMLMTATMLRRAAAGVAIDHAELVELAQGALDVFVSDGNDYGAAGIEVILTVDALLVGDVDAARAHTAAARVHSARTGDRYSASRIEYLLGLLAQRDGELDDAYRHFERALRLLDELGMHDAITAQARLLEPLAEQLGQPELAAQWRSFIAGRTGSWSYFDGTVAAASHNRDGLAARRAGDLERAARAHRRALDWYSGADIPVGVAFSACCLGFVAIDRDDRAAAIDLLTTSLTAATAGGDVSSMSLALEGIARLAECAECAAALLGGAQRWRAAAGATRPAELDVVVDETSCRLRAALGDVGFDRAAADGATMDRSALSDVARQVLGCGVRAHLSGGHTPAL